MTIGRWFIVGLCLFLSACAPVTATPANSPAPATLTPTQPAPPTATPAPTATSLPLTPTPTMPSFEVCCPLEGETIASLPLILVNPLVRPQHFGEDFGHPGLDFAYYQRGARDSIQGVEIYAILDGAVTLPLDDAYPYGNAILIETPLTQLPADLQTTLMESYQPAPEEVDYKYNCPDVPTPALTGAYSLYHLYAHMEQPPKFKTGDPIACGTKLGTVGTTGYSSNPHLHLETRLGPSGAQFPSMAHYLTTATNEQLSNYCLWRSSGYYQIVDPYLILNAHPIP